MLWDNGILFGLISPADPIDSAITEVYDRTWHLDANHHEGEAADNAAW